MKARINTWLARYKLKVSGSISLLEFKRRVLTSLAYLLTKLNRLGYQGTLDFVTNVLPSQQNRRQRICQPILQRLLPGATDQELTERARLYFRTLLLNGEKHFIDGLDSVVPGVQCYWARVPVREKKRYRVYEIGENKCSKSNRLCQVGSALQDKQTDCRSILEFLNSLPASRMTRELEKARDFLDKILNQNGMQDIYSEDPCSKVGDLLIALESQGVPSFYTMNFKESQAFCDHLGQNLSIRPNYPANDERTYLAADKPWPLP